MDLAELQRRLGQLRVQPRDTYRAALYIDYLDRAQTYFVTTMARSVAAGGLGDNYPFVAEALRSATLLKELADILDFYVAPAVNGELKRAYKTVANGGLGHGPGPNAWTYADYFTNQILNANFDTNVQTFRGRYRISTAALDQLWVNFRGNILLACRRIIADRVLLTKFYQDLYEDNFTILSLTEIKSTGSDFHKGGKQVLILTFDIVHTVDYGPPLMFAPTREELKVVYKPSDLEADCLIAGDSAAVNRVIPAFMTTKSLFEIYNRRLQTIKMGNPAFTGEPLTTYRILPRNYLSSYGGGYPVPIRDAYGYIQYLDYDVSSTAREVFGYYPFGASDYLIFQTQDRNAIVKSFYRGEGALAALCGSFSLVDMHIENLRVRKYQPYLIDLEISLTSAVNDIDQTELLGSEGGITGIKREHQDVWWEIRQENTPGKASLALALEITYYQNRLWSAGANRQKRTIAVSRRYLLTGFTDGMAVLRDCQQNNEFQDWFTRLAGIVVRYLPYGTQDFTKIRENIFLGQGEVAGVALDATQEAELRKSLTDRYNNFRDARRPAADPRFLSLTQDVSGDDYQHLDIPVFYYRIKTAGNERLDIVDSNGRRVPIPADVTINIRGGGGTQQVPVTGVDGVFNRATYFANAPTQTIVDQGQVQILGGVDFDKRKNLLRASIAGALGNNNGQNPPSEIVGFDK